MREAVRAGADWFVYDFTDLLLALEKPVPIFAEKDAAAEALAGGGEGKEEEEGAKEKEAAASTAGSGGGSRPRKTLPGMDPEEALRAFAESVGYKGDIMDGVVTECAGGAIEEIHWGWKDLDGTLPVGDLNMPKLRVLNLSRNSLKGEKEKELSTLGSGI